MVAASKTLFCWSRCVCACVCGGGGGVLISGFFLPKPHSRPFDPGRNDWDRNDPDPGFRIRIVYW